MASAACSPTWVQPSPDGEMLYVACNKAHYVLEVDRASLEVKRRFETGQAPYNLAVTPDGDPPSCAVLGRPELQPQRASEEPLLRRLGAKLPEHRGSAQ